MPVLANIEDHEIFGPVLHQGRQEGRREEAERILRGLIHKRFGSLPLWAEQRIAKSSVAELDESTLRVLDATGIEDVFSSNA